MAITFTGAGGLFTKIGHILGIILDTNKFRSVATPTPPTPPDTTPAVPTKFDTLVADYTAGTNQEYIADGLYSTRSAFQSNQSSTLSALKTLAQNTLIDIVRVDALGNTAMAPPDGTLATAMALVIQQMLGNMGGSTSHVTAGSLAAGTQTNVGSPVGSFASSGNSGPVIVSGVKDAKGNPLDYSLTETVGYTCAKDAITGGRAKFQEQITALGQPAVTDPLSWLWPGGSGASTTLSCVDANQNNQGTGGQILQNGEFTAFSTTNYPDNWVINTGVAGTNVLKQATGYNDTTSVALVGDGATLVSISQTFGVPTSTGAGTGGCPLNLLAFPDTPFAVNFWYQMSASSPAAGWLQCDLIDGSGSIINDDAGNANSFHVDLTTIADTNWHVLNGVFRLPANSPSAVKLRFWQPTGHALSAGKSVYVDRVGFTQATRLYVGGPYLAAFSGNLAPIQSDQWTVAYTLTAGNFQNGFQRLFGMTGLGLRLPTSGGSAIDDVVGSGHLISRAERASVWHLGWRGRREEIGDFLEGQSSL